MTNDITFSESEGYVITTNEVIRSGKEADIWNKFCGFLDLSISEFMEIQEQLLTSQIDLVYDSRLGRELMKEKPQNLDEFRQMVPMTTYSDYAPFLKDKNEESLAVKPYRWGHTSGRAGIMKWVPYSLQSLEVQGMCGVATLILACADKKGDVNIGPGLRGLHNLPPIPYSSGVLAESMAKQINAHLMPPIGEDESKSFQERIAIGFGMALRDGVDIVSSLTSVLIKMGQTLSENSGQIKLSRRMLHPQIALRLIRAWLTSKLRGRPLLPKDLWHLKGLIGYGMDTGIYSDELQYYWGRAPLEMYCGTEAGVIATQAWNKKAMTLLPYCAFLEFIEEQEWLKNREDSSYKPPTVLIDELRPGRRYEIITTSFYGTPFLRYRLGDLIRVVALEDKEAGIRLPQIVFESRADDIIDIAGFTRLDERTFWQAIANTKVKHVDWIIRRESEKKKPVIRLYIEMSEDMEAETLEGLVHKQLAIINHDYCDLEKMLGIRPLRVTLLPVGSFDLYYKAKQKAGADLAHLKPAHMNVADDVLKELLRLGKSAS